MTATPLLLGLTGGRGSGKDTAFEFISGWAEGRGQTACRRAFADKLKHSAALSLGFKVEESDAVVLMDELKRMGEITIEIPGQMICTSLDGRSFLQRYGTEGHRDVFHQNFWVDALLPVGEAAAYSYDDDWHANFLRADICVVTDVRFPNEARRIRSLGGQIWKISRETHTMDEHVSEAGIPDELIDRRIDNHGDLAELSRRLIDALTTTPERQRP